MVYHVLSWMTFGPEWVAGSPNLNTSNPLYLWVYLFVSFPPVPSPVHGIAQMLTCFLPNSF